MAAHSVLINNDLYEEIKEYCGLNGIKPSILCNNLLKKALTELKYGDIPFGIIKNERITEQKNEQTNEQINEPQSAPFVNVEKTEEPVEKIQEEDKKITKTKKVRVLK